MPYLGTPIERLEDASLLTGRGRYADDLGTKPGTLHAAVLRSPHAHADIVSIDFTKALAAPGVRSVFTGADAKAWAAPFVVGVKQPMEHWCIAVERVRYVGEPVAVVVAEDRYAAEDALDLIQVEYRPLPAVVDTEAAASAGAPVLHEKVGSNVVSDRHFSYGDPDGAFARAPHKVRLKVRYPRNSCTPIECYVVVAEHCPDDGSYEAFSNFQGPFALHPVMALALKVPGAKLRLRMPRDSGGSFGIKQGVFPYIVLMCLAARKTGAPVKWVQDRLEHLLDSSSGTSRVSTIEAAVESDGRIGALAYDQMDDCGAYLRAPEPATFYRLCAGRATATRIDSSEKHCSAAPSAPQPRAFRGTDAKEFPILSFGAFGHRAAPLPADDCRDLLRRRAVAGHHPGVGAVRGHGARPSGLRDAAALRRLGVARRAGGALASAGRARDRARPRAGSRAFLSFL